MVVQHNLTAMNSNRMLGITTGTQAKSTEKLSSGYKINRAADDAAGLSISEKMRKQIRGLSQASLNAEDGISSVQTAEGALNEVQDMLQRMNELAVKAANGTMSENDRSYIQDEIKQLETEIDRVAETTKFNETYLLKGDKAADKVTDYQYKVTGATLTDADGTDFTGTFYAKDGTVALTADEVKTALAKGETLYTNAKPATTQAADAAKVTAAKYTEATAGKITWANAASTSWADGDKITIGTTTVTLTADDDTTEEVIAKINATTGIDGTYKVEQDGTDLVISTVATGAAATKPVVKHDLGGAGTDTTVSTGSDGEDEKYASAAGAVDTTKTYYLLDSNEGLKGDALKAKIKEAGTAGIDLYSVAAGQEAAVEGEDYAFEETALYDKDGNKISANGLQFYYDEAGNYEGGLYTDKNGENAVADITTYVDDTQKKTGALTLKLHVGADATDNNQISVDLDAMSAAGIGVKDLKVDGADDTNARNAIETIKAAIQQVSQQRSALGAVQNRLEHTIANLDNVVENTTAAESQIRDTDMATEMVKYSNNNILAQAGQAMLAQANQANQGVLSLLG